MLSSVPCISVIIPLFNKESTIARAVSSVLNQTVDNFQLIIVEGASTDNSNKIVQNISDSRLKIIHQFGKGVSNARNLGISAASSEIIAFLDADDEWKPNFLETILKMATQYQDAAMFGTAYSVFSGEKHIQDIVLPKSQEIIILDSYFQDFVDARHPIIITSAFAAKKTAIESVGGYSPNLRIGEDHELFAKLALFYPVVYSSKVCSNYYLDAENNTDIIDEVAEVPLVKYLEQLENPPIMTESSDFKAFMDHWKLRIAGRNLYSGFRKTAKQQIKTVKGKSLFKTFMQICAFIPFPFKILKAKLVRKLMRVVGFSI